MELLLTSIVFSVVFSSRSPRVIFPLVSLSFYQVIFPVIFSEELTRNQPRPQPHATFRSGNIIAHASRLDKRTSVEHAVKCSDTCQLERVAFVDTCTFRASAPACTAFCRRRCNRLLPPAPAAHHLRAVPQLPSRCSSHTALRRVAPTRGLPCRPRLRRLRESVRDLATPLTQLAELWAADEPPPHD